MPQAAAMTARRSDHQALRPHHYAGAACSHTQQACIGHTIWAQQQVPCHALIGHLIQGPRQGPWYTCATPAYSGHTGPPVS